MADWTVGKVKITKIIEKETAISPSFLYEGLTEERVLKSPAWLRPKFVTDKGELNASIHSFVIESMGKRIMVDTCVGNDKERPLPNWNRLQGPFIDDLESNGFSTDSFDYVFCTHLHTDHIGWNTRLENGSWRPTFPEARYLFGRIEWEFWSCWKENPFPVPMEDSVQPVIDAGLVDIVESGHRITDEITVRLTPGHTPGHMCVDINSSGQKAIIIGDILHHPIQMADPELCCIADMDKRQAVVTRRSLLEKYADEPVWILGAHFGPNTTGHIVKDVDNWKFEA